MLGKVYQRGVQDPRPMQCTLKRNQKNNEKSLNSSGEQRPLEASISRNVNVHGDGGLGGRISFASTDERQAVEEWVVG